MKVLVTGVGGFIGFSFADHLLKNKKILITGIDNLDKYYSVQYKKKRFDQLKKNKKFNFQKIDISKKKILENFLKDKHFDIIFHFAAQPGVRYSLINPKKYISDEILKNNQKERAIEDFNAGMTDRYAINLHKKIK